MTKTVEDEEPIEEEKQPDVPTEIQKAFTEGLNRGRSIGYSEGINIGMDMAGWDLDEATHIWTFRGHPNIELLHQKFRVDNMISLDLQVKLKSHAKTCKGC